jgi:hypothetical protein
MIECEICNKELRQINPAHLHLHNMTIEQYKQAFPDAPTLSEETLKRFSENGRKNMTNLWEDNTFQEEHSKRHSEVFKKRWKDNREEMMEIREKAEKLGKVVLKEKWKTDKEFIEKMERVSSKNMKKLKELETYSDDPKWIEFRKKMSEDKSKLFKKLWKDPEYREERRKQSAETGRKTLTREWKKPEFRKKMKKHQSEGGKKGVLAVQRKPTTLEQFLFDEINKNISNVKNIKLNNWKTITISDEKYPREIDISFWIDNQAFAVFCDGNAFHGKEDIFGNDTTKYDYETTIAFCESGYHAVRYLGSEIHSGFAIEHLKRFTEEIMKENDGGIHYRTWIEQD